MLATAPLIGAERPRIDRRPPAVGTHGDVAVELAAAGGLVLEPWQVDGLNTMLSYREDKRWAAFEYGELLARQNGKALDTSTPMLTTAGWSTMGALAVGDEVFHPDGHPLRVVATSEVLHDRECYRVTTTDGRSVVADAGHLWTVQDRRRRMTAENWDTGRGVRGPAGRLPRPTEHRHETLTTRELLRRGLVTGVRRNASGGTSTDYALRLPLQDMVISKPVDLPIDPYLLGAWLGDGTSGAASLTVGDQDLDETCRNLRATDAELFNVRRNRTAWTVPFRVSRTDGRGGFEARARRLGVWKNKHVPDIYLSAGTEQRLALLQGLLDTDGTIEAKRGQVEFCSTRRALADGALFLARSLGWRATVRESAATLYGREVSRRWRVCFTPSRDEAVPFRLARKAARVRSDLKTRGGERRVVSIASIEPVESRPVRCIRVDRPDGLFLAGRGLLATHNSIGLLVPRAMAGFLLLGEHRILWSAHQYRTAMDAFGAMKRFLKTIGEETKPNVIDLGEYSVKVNNTNGDESFERLDTGAIVKLVARSKGSARGFSADCQIIDEAFAYTAAQQEAQMPTATAKPNAQIIYASSPPLDRWTGEVLFALRARALSGDDEGLAWRDWGLAVDLDELARMGPTERAAVLDDRQNWAAANPALGLGRVTEESLLRNRRSMTEEGFARECLGCWPVHAGEGGQIPKAAWKDCLDPESKPARADVVAVDGALDRTHAVLVLAGRRESDDLPHVEVIELRPGMNWVLERCKELHERHRCTFVVDPIGPAGSLVPDMQATGLTVECPDGREWVTACASLFDAVTEGRLRHRGQVQLDDAVQVAVRRDVGDGVWAWARRRSGGDIAALAAATAALWGLERCGGVEPWAEWV